MAFFDKVSKAATNIGKSAATSAATIGSNVGVAAQDQSELTGLKMQLNVVNQELDASYVIIGRKFVEYVISSGEMPGIDVSDILKLMDPKLVQKNDLEGQIIALEKKIKNNAVLREKEAAEAEFIQEKTKLDRALAMEVLSQEEYDLKLASARKKVENFEAIRKVEQQYEMKLITKEERDAKLAQLTQ